MPQYHRIIWSYHTRIVHIQNYHHMDWLHSTRTSLASHFLFAFYTHISTMTSSGIQPLHTDRYCNYQGWRGWGINVTREDLDQAWHRYLEKGGEKMKGVIYLRPDNIMQRTMLWWRFYMHAPPGVLFESVVHSMLAHGVYEIDLEFARGRQFDYALTQKIWSLRTRVDRQAVSLNQIRNIVFTRQSMGGAQQPLQDDFIYRDLPDPMDRLEPFLATVENT